MPLVQVFRPDLDLVYSRLSGAVDRALLRRWAVETFRHPSYRDGMNELVDLRRAGPVGADLGFDTIRELYECQRTWIASRRRRSQLVLVAPDDLLFGLCRIYASLAGHDGLHASPCRDWVAACQLLGIDPGEDLRARSAEG